MIARMALGAAIMLGGFAVIIRVVKDPTENLLLSFIGGGLIALGLSIILKAGRR